MTPTELEQTRIVAESAIEIVQDCRKALGLEKGELLTVAVTRLADDRERLLARVAEYEATGVKLCKQVVDLTSALDKAQRERDEAINRAVIAGYLYAIERLCAMGDEMANDGYERSLAIA
jgi:hypothetical protein